MTNAEKYLKDGVTAKELWKTFQAYYYKNKSKESDVEKAFRNFFEEKTQPTLTEDERVILRNIDKQYKKIYRNSYNEIILIINEKNCYHACIFKPNLFQFIKERRRIFNRGVVEK